ncbi:MAG: type II toxin-antitoxin system RelE/ParE family toxin [Thermodesulfobacteriota bacterium]
MIKTFANAATRKVYDGERPNRFAGLDFDQALARLDALDEAQTLAEIPALRSIGLHQLKGDRAGQWAMKINARWRLVFTWEEGAALDVEITDYHKG